MVARVQIGAIREFGRRVRDRRVAAGLSQAAFAEQAGLDRLYLGRLERGAQNPTLLVVARIAVALGASMATLLDGIDVDAVEVAALERKSRGPQGSTRT